jgi:hypothetical protein
MSHHYRLRVGLLLLAMTLSTLAASPANDNFANRLHSLLTQGAIDGTTVNATAEEGEQSIFPGDDSISVWFELQAPRNGGYEICLEEAFAQHQLKIELFWPGAWPNLQSYPSLPGSEYLKRVRLTQGEVILPRIYGHATAQKNFSLLISPAAENDEFERAGQIALGESAALFNIAGTRQAGEPAHHGSTEGASFWYQFIPEKTGSYILQTTSMSEPVEPLVYSGSSLISLQLEETQHTSHGILFSRKAGEALYVVFDSLSLRYFQFSVQPASPADSIAEAIPIFLEAPFAGRALRATVDPSEPVWFAKATVWNKFIPPSAEPVILRVSNVDAPIRVAVFEEISTTEYKQLTPSKTLKGRYPFDVIEFYPELGKTYLIGVDAFQGDASFDFELLHTSTNDSFEARRTLATDAINNLKDYFPSYDASEPQYPGLGPAPVGWWRWVAPRSGTFAFSASIENPGAVSIYKISDGQLDEIKRREFSVSNFGLSFKAEKGTEYAFAIAGFPSFPFDADVAVLSVPDNDEMEHARLVPKLSEAVSVQLGAPRFSLKNRSRFQNPLAACGLNGSRLRRGFTLPAQREISGYRI